MAKLVATDLRLAALAACLSTWGLPWLPHQLTGDDYSALTTSGVGPAVRAGHRPVGGVTPIRAIRTMLDVWVAVSATLLDNFQTMAGGARATIG
jgi:hypothetical protein